MILAPALAAISLLASPQNPDSLLITPARLAAQVGRPGLVLFHVGPRPDYDSAHIAGAEYIGFEDIDQRNSPLSLQIPAAAWLDSVLEARGVSDDSRVVVYWSSEWVSPTTRVVLTLHWFGLGDRVRVLDGGLAAWRGENRPVTREVPTPVAATGRLTPRPRADVIATADYVQAHLAPARGVTIVDARDTVFYHGRRPGAMPRAGRIPGAVSFPFSTVADSSGRFLAPAVLRARFAALGVQPGDTVVTYCHIGQQATAVWLAARLAGYEARMYDGSFQEWSRGPYPTVTSPRN